jgi:AIG2-like family
MFLKYWVIIEIPILILQVGINDTRVCLLQMCLSICLQPITVDVTAEHGELLKCRTYHLLQRGSEDRRPSPQYLDVIIRGAVEHKLPEYYVGKLRLFEHNGFPGPVPLYDHIMSSQQ